MILTFVYAQNKICLGVFVCIVKLFLHILRKMPLIYKIILTSVTFSHERKQWQPRDPTLPRRFSSTLSSASLSASELSLLETFSLNLCNFVTLFCYFLFFPLPLRPLLLNFLSWPLPLPVLDSVHGPILFSVLYSFYDTFTLISLTYVSVFISPRLYLQPLFRVVLPSDAPSSFSFLLRVLAACQA